ncbi:MAG: hypothetical protein JWM53_798 [bacterium]|nr:hypothetical protein [bacterium]
MVRLLTAFAALACFAAPATVRAVEDRAAPSLTSNAPVEQPFLYMVDPHGPAPRQVLAGYALAFSSSAGAIRPIPGNFDNEGVVHTLSLEVGLLDRLRVYAQTMIAESIGTASEVNAVALQIGARMLLTPPRWQRFRVMLSGAFVREFGAALGVFGELTASYDVGRVRLATSVHAEHIFAGQRDPVDLYAVAGVSVRVVRILRLGAEYVAQDLEALGSDDEAEGGARHYVGPDIALSLHKDRLLITAGGAVQLAHAPGVLARAALTYVY